MTWFYVIGETGKTSGFGYSRFLFIFDVTIFHPIWMAFGRVAQLERSEATLLKYTVGSSSNHAECVWYTGHDKTVIFVPRLAGLYSGTDGNKLVPSSH